MHLDDKFISQFQQSEKNIIPCRPHDSYVHFKCSDGDALELVQFELSYWQLERTYKHFSSKSFLTKLISGQLTLAKR